MIGRYFSMTVIAAALAAPAMAQSTDASKERAERAPNAEQRRSSAPASAATPANRDDARRYSDRAWEKTWEADKDKLEQALGVGKERAHYRQALEKMGYYITAVNSDEPDYLEYEVIHGKRSYEVQVDFDEDTKKSTEIDVTPNVWKADATEAALKDSNYKYVYPTARTPNAERYSDRARMKAARADTDKLEKELGTDRDRAHYRSALEKMGYRVTSVNHDKPDYVEYEVVKDGNSYEVQIDFDEKTRKSTEVDVTVNAVRADSTDRALDGSGSSS